MSLMPVVFIAHGSPMHAIAKNAFTERLKALGKKIPKPQAILCVSAHWVTQGTHVMSNTFPETIHDFHGFPKALFEVKYPASGSLDFAKETQKLVDGSQLNDKWGLDHGTWSVLIHLYPLADIPVYQLSLDINKTAEQHLKIGEQLRSLRENNVLIIGSGNIVHNLRMLNWQQPDAALPWATEFDLAIKNALLERDETSLTHYSEKFGEAAKLSVPTAEHYLPLLYCYGASTNTDKLSFFYEGYEMGSLSMRSALWSP